MWWSTWERVGNSMCLHHTQERFKEFQRNPMLIKLILKCNYNFRVFEQNDTAWIDNAAPRRYELSWKLYNRAWDISHKVIVYWFPRVTDNIGYCHWLSPITVWKTQLLMILHTGLRTNRHQSQSNWKDSNSIAFIVPKGTIQVPWVENTSIGLTCDGLCLLQYHPARNDGSNFAILITLF